MPHIPGTSRIRGTHGRTRRSSHSHLGYLAPLEYSNLPLEQQVIDDVVEPGDIPPGTVEGAALVDGTVGATKFASTIRAPEIVDVLPTLPDDAYPQGALVFYTVDEKLYRNSDGSTWTVAVDGADILANSVTAGQIAAGAIGADEIAADAVTSEKIAAGSIHVGQMAANPTNLVANGDFEDTAGYTFGTFIGPTNPVRGWETSGGSGTFRLRGDSFKYGSTSLESVRSGDTGEKNFRSDYVPVQGGRRVILRAWLRGTAGNDAAAAALIAFEAAKADGSAAGTPNPVNSGGVTVGASTTWVEYVGYGLLSNDTAAIRVIVRQVSGGGTTDAVRFDSIEAYYVDNNVSAASGDVVIDSTGIAVTNGAITVENAGSTVIIDGTSDMFRIPATGTASIPAYSGSGTSSVTVSLSGLGTKTTPIAYLAYATATGSVQKLLGLFVDLSSNSAYVATSSGGSPTTRTFRVQVYYDSDSSIVSSTATLKFYVNFSNSSGSAMTVRYYALDQVAL